MKKRYNKLNKKKIITLIIIFSFTLVTIILLRNYTKEKKQIANYQKKEYTSSKDFESIKEVFYYMNCKYIKEKNYSDGEFTEDIYLEFPKNLYEKDNSSNEKFYNKLIEIVVDVLNFKNFKLIDESKNIEIAVICNENERYIDKIYINDEENYFKKQESFKSLSKYKETPITQMQIQSKELKDLINNEWRWSKVDFGSQTASLNNDYIEYGERGIKLKTTGTSVFNIIFTNNYQSEILEGINLTTEPSEIMQILGEPTFEVFATDDEIIGYKGNNIYIFFSNGEISIYRVEKDYDTTEFLKLINKFAENENVNEFVNNLTNLWDNYSSLVNTNNCMKLTYASKGIKIEFGEGTSNGIVFYNNYTGNIIDNYTIKDIYNKNVILPNYVYINTEEDLIFECEKERTLFSNIIVNNEPIE